MDKKLMELIADGSAVLEKIHDGVHYVKDPETGKVYEWIDGEASEVLEVKKQVVAPPTQKGDDKIEAAKAIMKKRGLFL